jgi:predicted RNase H-like HicB family nuclease
MQRGTIAVMATWDPEAKVYTATSEDVPGLVAEAESVDEMIEKLQTLVPELLELNGAAFLSSDDRDLELPMIVTSSVHATIKMRAHG